MIYLRYEFNDKEQADSKIEAFNNEDGAADNRRRLYKT